MAPARRGSVNPRLASTKRQAASPGQAGTDATIHVSNQQDRGPPTTEWIRRAQQAGTGGGEGQRQGPRPCMRLHPWRCAGDARTARSTVPDGRLAPGGDAAHAALCSHAQSIALRLQARHAAWGVQAHALRFAGIVVERLAAPERRALLGDKAALGGDEGDLRGMGDGWGWGRWMGGWGLRWWGNGRQGQASRLAGVDGCLPRSLRPRPPHPCKSTFVADGCLPCTCAFCGDYHGQHSDHEGNRKQRENGTAHAHEPASPPA